jgi:hypothetical protein
MQHRTTVQFAASIDHTEDRVQLENDMRVAGVPCNVSATPYTVTVSFETEHFAKAARVLTPWLEA